MCPAESNAASDTPATPPKGPLDGVRVIDLTTVLFGPYCTQILGEMGAEVIKIEQPAGDTSRHVGPSRSPGMSGPYLIKARNKRSIMLDLKQEEGREIFRKLIASADAFVHNIRPKPAARIGIDYETVSAIRPDIVYCAATGFRPDGPYADKAAYDDLIQGLSGFAALNGQVSGGEPRYAPSVIVDKISGLFASYSVSMALFHRERTGEGQRVDVGMFECFTSFLLQEHLQGRSFEPPLGPAGYVRLLSPYRRPYKTADGHICAIPYTDRHWRAFFRLANQPELAADERFATIAERTRNIDALYAILAEALETRTSAEWLEALEKDDIPCMRMHDVESVIDDPHLKEVGFFSEMEHPTEGRVRIVEPPVRFSKTPGGFRSHAEHLGESSVPILEGLGYSGAEIADLLAKGATLDGRRT